MNTWQLHYWKAQSEQKRFAEKAIYFNQGQVVFLKTKNPKSILPNIIKTLCLKQPSALPFSITYEGADFPLVDFLNSLAIFFPLHLPGYIYENCTVNQVCQWILEHHVQAKKQVNMKETLILLKINQAAIWKSLPVWTQWLILLSIFSTLYKFIFFFQGTLNPGNKKDLSLLHKNLNILVKHHNVCMFVFCSPENISQFSKYHLDFSGFDFPKLGLATGIPAQTEFSDADDGAIL